LIASGGEPQYFPPGEEFIVRNSRWVFGVVLLLLAAGFVWSVRKLGQFRSHDYDGSRDWRRLLLHAGLPLVIDIALIGFIFLKLLPDNNTNLPLLLKNAPDIGLLALLILLLSAGWGIARTVLFVNTWNRRPGLLAVAEA
jgi:hypothetical protein